MSKNAKADKRIPVFKGTPREVGEQFASVNKKILMERYRLWLEDSAGAGLREDALISHSKRYVEVTEEEAPWHLEEAEGAAEYLKVPPKLFTAYLSSNFSVDNIAYDGEITAEEIVAKRSARHRGKTPGDEECTSIIAVGTATADGNSIIHKNRDRLEIDPQSLYSKEVIYQGKALNRFIGISYVHDLGYPGAFINDKGVSGTVNAGEPYPDPYRGGGLPSRGVMRIIAETACCCEDVLGIILPLISRPGYYSNSKGNGQIWLFTDKEKGLIIENTARAFAFEYIYDDVAIRANDFLLLDRDKAVGNLGRERPGGRVRRERTLKRLQAKKGSITPETIIGAARDWEPPVDTTGWTKKDIEAYLFSNICKEITISGFTGVSRKEHTHILSHARVMNGHPNNSFSLPAYLGCRSMLLPQIDGELSLSSYKRVKGNPVGENKDLGISREEEGFRKKILAMEAKAAELLDMGKEEEAKEVLTEGSNEIGQRAVHLMRYPN